MTKSKRSIISVISIAFSSAIVVMSSLTGCANSRNTVNSEIKKQITKYNEALSLEESKANTMYDALQILVKNGYSISEVKSNIENSEILYDSINNAFCFYNGTKIEYYPETTNVDHDVKENEYWSIVDVLNNAPTAKFNKDWSIYIRTTSESEITVTTGVDVGSCNTISKILYKSPSNDSQKEVIIRTNSFVSNLTINASNDLVSHYNEVGSVNILAIGSNSYHEYAYVNNDFVINSGRVVIEPSGEIVKGKITIDVANDKKVRLDYRNESRGYALLDRYGNQISINNDDYSNIKGYVIDESGREIGPIGGCKHIYLEKGDVIKPTCTAEGYTEYHCVKCNATKKDNIIPATGHDFSGPLSIDGSNGHYHTCKICGKKSNELEAHIYNIERASETEDKVCIECGYIAERATGHKCPNHLSKIEAKAATCTEAGNVEYYRCSCGKNYFDSKAQQLVLDTNDLNIKPLNHDFSNAYQYDETTHWHECNRCDATSTHEKHSYSIEQATEIEDKVCTVCGYIAEKATGHKCKDNLIKIDANYPTCLEPGNIEYYQCSCGKNYFDNKAEQLVIDANDLNISPLDHDFLKTYQCDGNFHWHKCSRCEEITEKAAHIFNIEHATETENKVCLECGYVAEKAIGHQCKNHLVHVDRKDPSCTAQGNIEYYRCNDLACGKNYFDNEATQLITDIRDIIIDALDHDFKVAYNYDDAYHWHECNRCDATSTHEKHSYSIEQATEIEDKVCTECGYIAEKATGHKCKDNLIKIDANYPSCLEPGNIEYYQCSCGKNYFDNKAEQLVIDANDLNISPLDHDFLKTYQCDGNFHWHKCSRCDEITEKVSHTFNFEHATETEDKVCLECGYVAEKSTGHQCKNHLVHVDRKDPTCTAQGSIEYYRCDDLTCGKNYFDNEATQLITDIRDIIIDALDHDFKEPYEYDEIYHWHGCNRCGVTSTYEKHSYSIEHATETEDKVCLECGYVAEKATGHLCKNHLIKIEAKSPTCTEVGNVEYYKCSCGKCYKDSNALELIKDELTLIIPALGHDYNVVIVSEPHTTPNNLSPTGSTYLECSVCHDVNDRREISTPSYWEDNLVPSIIPNPNNFNFIYLSDPHFDVDNASASSAYYNFSTNVGLEIKRTAEYAGINTILITGDNSTSAAKSGEKMKSSLQFSKNIYTTQLSGLNVLTTRGNHDGCYGTSYATQMKPSEVNSLISPHISISGSKLTSGEDGSYYYVDYPSYKVRIIALNAYYVTDSDYDFKNQDVGRYGKQQLTWLINDALKFDESGWSIILMTHTVNEFKGPVSEVRDQNVLFGILNAYYNKTSYIGSLTNAGVGSTYNYTNLIADFTTGSNGADIIGLFSGHCHIDNVNTSLASFPIFSIVSATNECKQMGTDGWVHSVGEFPNRTKFSKTETAFDIVSVDLVNKEITLTRVGDGNGSVRSAIYNSNYVKKDYSISTDIPSHINYSSSCLSMSKGETFTANISSKSYKYEVGNVTVKMGTTTLINAYDSNTGNITINNVTGNITISVTEVSKNVFSLYQSGMKFSSTGYINKAGQEISELTNIKVGYDGNNIAGPFQFSNGDVIHLENMRMGRFTGCPDNGAMSIGISSSNVEFYLGSIKGYLQCSGSFTFATNLGSVPDLRLSYEYDSTGLLTTITVVECPKNSTLYMYLGYFNTTNGDPGVYIEHIG